jgi:sortase (surface protein transpeptidase)
MDPTDYPALTMITCYPYLLDTHRVVVTADLAE